ncbi:MAG: HAD family hydrolase [Bacteroidaceae bacterium]|nr:HAD family hydrolase [Bacteroidaceae bacterium]
MNSIKGIIFDYGGTIDTNGIHWSEVIWEQFVQAGAGIEKPLFREAYVHAERTLAKQRIIEPTHTFRRLLELKIAIEADYLAAAGKPIDSCTQQKIVEGCYSQVKKCIKKSCSIVKALSEKYPTVLVTNFYGNMPVVLKEFSLDKYFGSIIESAVVGIRKPDPRLFALGVKALGLQANEVIVIGDSYRKDIYPSLSIGCKAVWLKKICWEEEPIIPGAEPTAIIGDIAELTAIMQF